MGYPITLHLDSATRTKVEEFATSAFLGHKLVDGRHTLVVPASENSIDSATADSLITLAGRKGWTVETAEVMMPGCPRQNGIASTDRDVAPFLLAWRSGRGSCCGYRRCSGAY